MLRAIACFAEQNTESLPGRSRAVKDVRVERRTPLGVQLLVVDGQTELYGLGQGRRRHSRLPSTAIYRDSSCETEWGEA